jgi:hypothetical protein
MSLMEVLVQLERALDDLSRRWDQYLAREPGAAMPGAAEIDALEQRIRQAGFGHTPSAAERNRLGQLTARFGTKAASWRQVVRGAVEKPPVIPSPRPATRTQPAAPVDPRPAQVAPPPTTHAAAPSKGAVDPARTEEYRRLFARYQAAMERAGEPIPTSFDRFVRELEDQRQRLLARGNVVEGFDIVREASGVHVRPRTRAGGH